MVKKDLHIRITERRMNKIRLYSAEKDKTITQIIEELIDTLPEPKKSNITEG
jgi:translation elongation factor EF-4